MNLRPGLFLLASLMLANPGVAEDVIRDGDVGISRAELEYIVRNWSPAMQDAAARDVGDRLELLNLALANKKIAAEADKLTPEDGDVYWQKELTVRAAKRKLVVDRYLRNAELPDMTDLAREYYLTQKDKYAAVPEQRLSSHILFKCADDSCDRAGVMARAASVLEQLEKGAAFEDLAREHSEDLRSGANGGRYDRWLDPSNKQVAPEYIEAVFGLQAEGDHTGVTPSRFGYHIIRLDEIKPPHYRPFEEAKDDIIAAIRQEYHELNAKAFDARFRISDDAVIDGQAMEEIFAPYKTAGRATPGPATPGPATPGGADSKAADDKPPAADDSRP